MTNEGTWGDLSEIVGTRVRALRIARSWSIEHLAKLCADAGAPQLTVPSLYALESGRKEKDTGRRRRHITVDELLVLAAVLRTHPVDLLVPPDRAGDEPYAVAPGLTAAAATARDWIGGRAFLDEPQNLAEFAEATRGLSKARVDALWKAWLTRERMDEINRGALAWQRENDPPMPSMLEAIENVAAASTPADRERVIREMVGNLGEVGDEDALQQLGDELNQRKKEGGEPDA